MSKLSKKQNPAELIKYTTILIMALKFEISWSHEAESMGPVTPYEYTLIDTAPKVQFYLKGLSLEQFLKKHHFILDAMDMTVSNGRVIRVDSKETVSYKTLLKRVQALLRFYEFQIINKKRKTHGKFHK